MTHDLRDLRVLIVFPENVAEAIAQRRTQLGLPPIEVSKFKYGLDEVMQIVNLLSAKLLTGQQANITGLLGELRKGWDIVWLITHAEEAGWFLSDGIVSLSETTALIRSSGTFLTVMNTCSSYAVAREAAAELGTAFICTLSEVPDRTAFITGVLFAQGLAAGMDYVSAYENAKPGQNSTYELLQARRAMTPSDRSRRDHSSDMPDAETLHKFIDTVQDLNLIVYGDSRLGLPPLRDMTRNLQIELAQLREMAKSLERQLDRMSSDIAEIRNSQKSRNKMLIGMATAIVILVAIIGILVYSAPGVT